MSLAAVGLGFGYRDKLVGQGVDLELKEREVLCLLGPNGGGKTTLMKTLLGLLAPLQGMVRLDGEDISTWSRARLARAIGYVPQAHAAFFPFRVIDIVVMGRSAHIGLFAAPSAEDLTVADRALATLGIEGLRDRTYTEISGGERQLVLIARALAQEPRFLVMDEPTASLDFGNQARVLARIRDLAAAGMAVLLSTHDPDHVFQCAHRAALLGRGGLIALGRPEEVITPDNLRRIYGIEVRVLKLPEGGTHTCVPVMEERFHSPT
ncbi:MAG TPA: ABC transporter ATP-binding protein [Stellaceae bacterium]|nr:ABC transporter ATP-binding protein [Stellaceae bacterium]